MTESNMVMKLINCLRANIIINIILVIIYALVILFLHDFFVKITLHIKDVMGIVAFNNAVSIISITFLVLFGGVLVNQLLKNKSDIALKLFYLFSLSGIMILHSRIMFELNIEIIHSLEYAVLAFLLFPLFNRFGAAVIFALPVMLVDEWFQYQVMYKEYVEYFELNDVLMDTFGCGFIMIMVWIFGVKSKPINKPFWKTPEYIFLSLLIIILAISISTCFFSLYEVTKCDNTWLVLNKLKSPDSFWQIHPFHKSKYHVMLPIEGFSAIVLSCLFFASIDILKNKDYATVFTSNATSVKI
jgi:hypothetical protein